MKKKKLKPVVFVHGSNEYHRDNRFQQNLLLKALQITTDVNELKKAAGLKTAADVYRTLDKMALRKDFHEALAAHNLSLFDIVGGIKDICKDGKTDSVRLRGYQTLLKALGLSDYREEDQGSKDGWEDVVLKNIAKNLEAGEKKKEEATEAEYEVVIPEIPEKMKTQIKKEKEIGESLYED